MAVRNPVNEVVFRRSIDVWNADDWEKLESLWNPDGHIVAPEGWPESGRREGWEAIRKQFDRIKESWMLCAFDDGLFTSIEYFLDRDAAMAAAERIER